MSSRMSNTRPWPQSRGLTLLRGPIAIPIISSCAPHAIAWVSDIEIECLNTQHAALKRVLYRLRDPLPSLRHMFDLGAVLQRQHALSYLFAFEGF